MAWEVCSIPRVPNWVLQIYRDAIDLALRPWGLRASLLEALGSDISLGYRYLLLILNNPRYGLRDSTPEVKTLLSHAVEARLKVPLKL